MSKKALYEVGKRRQSDRLKLLKINQNVDEHNEEANEVPIIPNALLPVEMVLGEEIDNPIILEDPSENREDDRCHGNESNSDRNILDFHDSPDENFETDEENNQETLSEDSEEFDSDQNSLSEDSQEYDSDESSNAENEQYADIFPEDGDDINDEPLYRGSPVTVMESMLLILSILLHHNVTMTCLSDIITVINFHCLQVGLKKNSLYKFRKYFSIGKKDDVQKQFYCATCIRLLRSRNDICPSCPRKKNCYFVHLSFLNQLKEMYKRGNFYNNLQYRFNRQLYTEGSFSDIFDGSLYKTWFNGFLSNPDNISLSWYTDGIPVFKSSKISLWPIYLTINELPFEMRKNRENTLLAGMWHGNSKPDMNIFFHSLRTEFEKLSNGIEVFVPSTNNTIFVKGVLLTGISDTPARCECYNFVNFNGKYGCSFCTTEGASVPLEPQGHVRAFPYENMLHLRTSKDCETFALTATADEPVMGVKGATVFSQLMPDFIQGTGLDRMHCVEGGVVKKVLNLLFNVEHRLQPFSLYLLIDIINYRLKAIKPPKFVHRMPRLITELVHWKASELKMWLFYYSLPVLQGILRKEFFDHYVLLVIAIALLSSDVVTPRMIQISRNLLNVYVKQFETLYGLRFCSINVHQLLHFPDIVERLGPLWANTCFEYEDLNGQFLKLIHGTNHIDSQVVNSHNQFISMTRFMEGLPDGNLKTFCQQKKRQVKINEQISEHCYTVGTYKLILQVPNLIQTAIQNLQPLRNFKLWTFSRLMKNGRLYVANNYKNDLQTCSSTAQYIDNNNKKLGIIDCFIKINNCNCDHQNCECNDLYFAVFKSELISSNCFYTQDVNCHCTSETFLQQCQIVERIFAIPVENLVSVCVYMNIDNFVYVGIPVNTKELE